MIQMHKLKVDKILLIALLLGLAVRLYGIHWGWVECWYPAVDQIAVLHLGCPCLFGLPLYPETFLKPPFHTYFNFFLSVLPLEIIGNIFHWSPNTLASVTLIWSRLITVFLFLGAIALVFYITKRFFGIFAARIIAIVFSTSAGLIPDTQYLTADIPLIFWMLVAFYFTQSISLKGKVSDYVLAGFFTGIATATKYNGLVVGIAIVVAHILSLNSISWKELILSKKLFWGLVMVPIGFLAGNPFALLDYSNFISDFMYNYIVTPVYDGSSSGKHSYKKFLLSFRQIIGSPGFWAFGVGLLFSIYLLFTSRQKWLEKKGILLLLAVFLLYYYKFGSFARLNVRFVFPIVPFWLMLSGSFWQRIKPNKMVVSGLLIIILSYNLISSFYVGKLLAEDPRMQAQEWVSKNVPNGSSIESNKYSPTWNLLPGVSLKQEEMPYVNSKIKLFAKLFPPNSWVMQEVRKRVSNDPETAIGWYSLEQLMKRRPDYIAIDSIFYDKVIDPNLYPSVKEFHRNLLDQRYPYKIVFDRSSPTIPKWVYPQQITYADNRITILARSDLKASKN
jgi:hypothetical protein